MSNKIRISLMAILVLVAGGLLTLGISAERARSGSASVPQAQQVVEGHSWTGPQPPLHFLRDEEYLHWPLPASEQAYGKIVGSHLKDYVNQITAISRKSRDDGNQYWGRITGTPYDKMTTDWVAAQFRRIGLEQVRIQEFDLPPQWFPTSWEVVASGGGKTVPIKTAFPQYASIGTPASGIELEPLWVSLGDEADYLGRDARGKAVFIYSLPTPSGRNHSAAWGGAMKRAEDHGAGAIFVVFAIPDTNVTAEPGGGATTPPARVPVFVIGQRDGLSVRQLIEQGQAPKVRIRMAVEMKTGLKSASVWGVLPGRTDENILVMAHSESFFEGALDNASGVATMIGLAEYFAKVPTAQRRRTMTFATTSSHHASGDFGIRWIHNNMAGFFGKTALIVNCEHTSQTQAYWLGAGLMLSNTTSARRWFVGGSDQLKAIVANAFRTFGVALYSRPETRPGGELGPVHRDAPGVHIIDHTFYHTDMDVPALVPASGMEQVARAYAKIIDEVNKLDLTSLRHGIPTQ